MTTVGYGDKAPKTVLGRTVGCMAMISGIVLISLPVAIVGNKFQQAYEVLEQSTRAAAVEEQEEIPSSEPVSSKTSIGPVFQTIRFLESAKMLTREDKSSGDVTKTDVESFTPTNKPEKKKPKNNSSPMADPSLTVATALREKLRKLEGRRSLSRAAQGQVELMLELLDHLETVDDRLSKLHEKDAALDVCIHRDFVALSRVCSVQQTAPASS